MLGGTLGNWLLAAEGVLRKKPQRVPPEAVRSILVLEYRIPLGCLVHMTPVFEAIKRSHPWVQVAVSTRGLGLQVLRHSPFIDRLIEAPDPTASLSAAIRGLRRELRRCGMRPGCVLTGASDQRTRIALMAMLGCDGWRGGYTIRPELYHLPLRYDDGLSLIRNNLRLAKLIGCGLDVTRPRVFFSEKDVATARALLGAANPTGMPLIVMVTQTSGGQRTGWHTDRFVRVIADTVRARGCAVVYVGTEADEAAIEAIQTAAGGLGVSIAGKTTVSELAAVLALSDFAITLDTGTMHVGRASGVPMVVLGPSWQSPLEWMPLDAPNVRILRGPDTPVVPPGYRLDEISAENVIAALADLMESYPPSAQSRDLRLQEGTSGVDHFADL